MAGYQRQRDSDHDLFRGNRTRCDTDDEVERLVVVGVEIYLVKSVEHHDAKPTETLIAVDERMVSND
ncbi:hypothetical protein [Gulosibacter molinativorax]|uniref:hypothetical protein n=1 Tax=Gulosibacter molinativorax TaxID=256821 RepID=UPI00047C190C|nr:hypothetical protein [Gulosibacter molinativorax]QUY62789.1 Hypotetical protein [Gulosibacter molinativorax]